MNDIKEIINSSLSASEAMGILQMWYSLGVINYAVFKSGRKLVNKKFNILVARQN
jgi:hypothetical protein